MKKLAALLMAVIMVLSFAACGTDKEDKDIKDEASVPEISDNAPVEAPDAAPGVVTDDAGAANAPADNAGTQAPAEAPNAADAPAADADAAPQPKN